MVELDETVQLAEDMQEQMRRRAIGLTVDMKH